jgi:hypothetical protein
MRRKHQISERALRIALATAEQQLLRSGNHPAVSAVALGQQAISVFVTAMPPGAPELATSPMPRTITISSRGVQSTVPLRILTIGPSPSPSMPDQDLPSEPQKARLIKKVEIRERNVEQPNGLDFINVVGFVAPQPQTQPSLQIGATLSTRSAAGGDGVCSWIGTGIAITAAHVVGFDSIGKVVYSGGVRVGTVDRIAYSSSQIDAARIQLDAATQTPSAIVDSSVLPRFVGDDDVFSGANPAIVYLPHLGGIYSVKIHYVHATGDFQMQSPVDGFSFNPRPLILTDNCTVRGESGTILLGSDRKPIGLLSGRVYVASENKFFSAFTELLPAIQELG